MMSHGFLWEVRHDLTELWKQSASINVQGNLAYDQHTTLLEGHMDQAMFESNNLSCWSLTEAKYWSTKS